MADRVSHDQNFKNLILDYPGDALAFFVPAEILLVEDAVETIPLRQEQLQRRLGERYRELDVPLLVTRPGGRRDAILFALEEETDERRFSLHRFVHYCLDLGELYKTDRETSLKQLCYSGDFFQAGICGRYPPEGPRGVSEKASAGLLSHRQLLADHSWPIRDIVI